MKKAHFLSNPVDYRIYDRKQRSGQRGQVMQKTKQIADNTKSSPGWARTTDTRINSPLLCQLSYKGIFDVSFDNLSKQAKYDSAAQPLVQRYSASHFVFCLDCPVRRNLHPKLEACKAGLLHIFLRSLPK